MLAQRVAQLYDQPNNQLDPTDADKLRSYLTDEFELLHGRRQSEHAALAREQTRLNDERLKLLQAHYAGAIPLDLMKTEQARIAHQLAGVERKLTRLASTMQQVATALNAAIGFLTDLRHTYSCATDTVKRQINQAMFEQILVDADDPATSEHQHLYRQILATNLLTAARAPTPTTKPKKSPIPSDRRIPAEKRNWAPPRRPPCRRCQRGPTGGGGGRRRWPDSFLVRPAPPKSRGTQ